MASVAYFIREASLWQVVLAFVAVYAAILIIGIPVRRWWSVQHNQVEPAVRTTPSERYGGVTVDARNIGVNIGTNLTVVIRQDTEAPPTDEQAASAPQATQGQSLTASGHPAPEPLPPDAASRDPLRDLSFRITDLEPGSRIIRDRTFVDCVIHGPAIFVLDQSPLYEARLSPSDAESLLWDIGYRGHLAGVIAIKHCVFRRCTFVGVGFAGPPQFIQEFRNALSANNPA
jgi:hypothetical protein